jgi:hypothetical protein
VWADGQELDLTLLTMRVYRGDEAQAPDPLIVAKEGAAAAPAYRGLAYVVFEKLPLAAFGNRVPQFSFEVVRAVGRLAPAIRAVCLIPGATEFGYATTPVSRTLGLGASAPENRFQLGADTDVEASLDQLQALCPNLESVSLVVTWFGDDLRAGHCTVAPRVDLAGKVTSGAEWGVAGLTRATAREVSRQDGVAAYGGTPSDGSVVALIQVLKARGLAVTLYPFLMMDVPAANDRVDPRMGVAPQPPYPWRGRITCDPAPDHPGTVDGTAAAADQVAGFFGAAAEAWSFGRLVRHYAGLAAAAGGVDGFVVGSELVGLTRVRSGPGTYPAVAHLRGLAPRRRRSSARPPASSTRQTGPNTAPTSATAARRCASHSTRSGPTRRSMPSGSTGMRRSPTGATGRTTSTRAWPRARPTRPTCASGWEAAKPSTGSTRATRTAPRRRAVRSPMEPTGSPGPSGRRTSPAGGRIHMSSAPAASRSALRAGRRARNRSG